MTNVTRLLLIAGLASLGAAPLQAQGMRGISGGFVVNTPIGQFDSLATTGFGVAFRTALGDPEAEWSGRAALGLDYFKGKNVYSNVQFFGVGFDLVHRSRPSFYQFVGLVQQQSKFAGKASASGFAAVRQTSDFGFTGGVGVNFEMNATRLFVEFAATTVLTGASNSNFFPVRAGIRF